MNTDDNKSTTEVDYKIISRIVHDLGGPVCALRGLIDLWEESLNRGTQDHGLSLVSTMKYCINHIEHLIFSLRFLVRFRQQPEVFEKERHRCLFEADIIRPVLYSLAGFLHREHQRPVEVVVDGIRDLPPMFINRRLMWEAVYELIHNAAKYGSGSQIRIHGEILPELFRIKFQDSGVGIPDEESEIIFRLGNVGTTTTRDMRCSGLGMGLYMARTIARLHGGELTLTSCAHPTEFTIEMPQYLATGPDRD